SYIRRVVRQKASRALHGSRKPSRAGGGRGGRHCLDTISALSRSAPFLHYRRGRRHWGILRFCPGCTDCDMKEPYADDRFIRSAGRQLAIYAVGAGVLLVLLMFLLNLAARLTSSGSVANGGVDV